MSCLEDIANWAKDHYGGEKSAFDKKRGEAGEDFPEGRILPGQALRLGDGDACAVERKADALHCRWIDAKPSGDLAHTGPSRSRQNL